MRTRPRTRTTTHGAFKRELKARLCGAADRVAAVGRRRETPFGMGEWASSTDALLAPEEQRLEETPTRSRRSGVAAVGPAWTARLPGVSVGGKW